MEARTGWGTLSFRSGLKRASLGLPLALCLQSSACTEDDLGEPESQDRPADGDLARTGGEAIGSSTGQGEGGSSAPVAGQSGAGEAESPQRGGSTTPVGDGGSESPALELDTRLLHRFCEEGFDPDPRDALITSQPDHWIDRAGNVDLVLPAPVLAWMTEGVWQQSHDAWHNIRRCGRGGGFGALGGFGGFGGFGAAAPTVKVCDYSEMVPEDQECENASDGYQFLVMHRHMIQGLKQAFPTHAALFEGFPSFPFSAQDVPEPWRDRWSTGWTQSIRETAEVLEDIENNLERFPSEGDLGKYIQCGGSGLGGFNSIHGALHFKWVVQQSPHSLGNQAVNIENYMFWRLHGWIDDVWERYRVAKGLRPDQPQLTAALVAQCDEMHALGHLFDSAASGREEATDPLPEETGFFHERVRPILEEHCLACHSGSGPQGNLVLAGNVSSAQIVAGLVNEPAFFGGQFARVVPERPDQSWLYLKVSGAAQSAGCQGSMCNLQVMPPSGGVVTLSETELATLREWIASGAPAPTAP